MKITIENCENGWIISFNEEQQDGKYIEVKELILDKVEDGIRGITYLLKAVNDHFGSYDKYKNDNLRISWDLEGNKYESN